MSEMKKGKNRMLKEKLKLTWAVICFAVAMLKRLYQKANEGYKGWDYYNNPSMIGHMLSSMDYKVCQVRRGSWIENDKYCIDTANLAMMLRYCAKRLKRSVKPK